MAHEKAKLPHEKAKVDQKIELVEDAADVLSAHSSPTQISQPPDGANLLLTPNSQTGEPVEKIQTPIASLKSTMLNAAPFVCISLALFSIAAVIFPVFSLHAPYSAVVHTMTLVAVAWNLIGAVLFAQAGKRQAKVFIFVIFAIPLVVTPFVVSILYTLAVTVRSL